jgi:hypothetical protein
VIFYLRDSDPIASCFFPRNPLFAGTDHRPLSFAQTGPAALVYLMSQALIISILLVSLVRQLVLRHAAPSSAISIIAETGHIVSHALNERPQQGLHRHS